jgi:hypothetical protein
LAEFFTGSFPIGSILRFLLAEFLEMGPADISWEFMNRKQKNLFHCLRKLQEGRGVWVRKKQTGLLPVTVL